MVASTANARFVAGGCHHRDRWVLTTESRELGGLTGPATRKIQKDDRIGGPYDDRFDEGPSCLRPDMQAHLIAGDRWMGGSHISPQNHN